MKAVVFANGENPEPAVVREALADAGLTVAADGATDHALSHGVVPDIVIGDLDSLSDRARAKLPEGRIVHDPDPDRTDLQKAVETCLDRGASEITVLGAGGRRADHALANLSVLFLYRERAPVTFLDERFAITAAAERTRLDGPPGTVVSLVAIGTCSGVTTRGLRWDLADASLEFSPRGVHNEIRTSPATVFVRSGDLLVFKGRWIEKHR
ncbi:MAG: thiamine diphosphokinase [Dehalococcoidia bacterium]